MSVIRYYVVVGFLACLYILLLVRLAWFGMQGQGIEELTGPSDNYTIVRPDIVDRNGILLARDIQTFSLFAQPKKIINRRETVHMLSTVLLNLKVEATIKKLKSKQSFVWIMRNISLQQKNAIRALGLPGLGFRSETHRYYTNKNEAAYILGYVNIDNKGLAGIEKYIDNAGLSKKLPEASSLPNVALSVDIRVQSLLSQILRESMAKYQAQGAGALIEDIHTGEILAMNSLPDFNPLYPAQALQPDRLNRMSTGLYEMGSVVKIFTTAMALDSNKFNLDSMIDISKPLEVGPHQFIHDFHGLYKPLSVSGIFVHSSNIGSAKEAAALGIVKHRAFLKKIGLLDKLQTQLPELATTIEPRKWKKVNSMTIAFGHGIMFTPLQVANSGSALVNGGYLLQPSFLKNPIISTKKRVISAKTSKEILYLLGLNMKVGSGHFANEVYYDIGGKTGTAEKVENGKYSKDKNFNSFLAVFPLSKPRYLVLTIIDNPKKLNEHEGKTAGFSAAPMAVEIINRCANFLAIHPKI